MPFVHHHHADIAYHVYGTEGEPLIFVHGAGSNALVWFQQVAHFSKFRRCITMDIRGFHESRCAPEHVHQRYFPDDVIAVMDALGLERAAVVCQSMGAWAGLPLAVRHPDRVKALVLSSSPTPAYGPHHEVLQVVGHRFDRVKRGENVALSQLGFTDHFLATQPALVQLYRMLGRLNPPECQPTDSLGAEELRLMPEHFVGYRVPTLVANGKQNQLLGPDIHLQVAACIPGARTYTFEQSGHFSFYEEAEHYNRVVEQFLADVKG